MRNLKRVLSLALALVMMLGMMVIGASAASADFDDAAEIDYTEAVDVLTGLGVLEGDDKGNFNPTDILTRAQAAKIICYTIMGPANAEKLGPNTTIFKDVPATHWAAGYISYCTNLGILAGYGDGTFGPEDELTGVAFGKLLLVAAGYDAEAQGYVGDNWALNIGTDMIANGLDIKGVVMSDPLTREQAAQMCLQALEMNTVEYLKGTVIGLVGPYTIDTSTNNGRRDEANNYDETPAKAGLNTQQFCEKYFPNLKKTSGADDDWGRPADHAWKNKNKTIATVMQTPVAVYTTAVAECDIAEELNIKKKADISAATLNGEGTTLNNMEINATATKVTIGAQGLLTEVYEDGDNYEIVMIDTYLAKVTDVTEVEYDRNGHIDEQAELDLTVYSDAIGSETLKSDTDWDYSKGDMLLVYYNEDTEKVTIVDYADSLVGGQTAFTKNAYVHIIEDTEYPDAVQFNLDETEQRDTDDYTWYFDLYGNVIGAVKIATKTTHAVISSIYWKDSFDGEDGYAKAVITYMDGTDETVTIYSIDGYVTEGVEGNHAEMDDVNEIAYVSSTKSYNKSVYVNQALYEIESSKKGLKLTSVDELIDAEIITGVPSLKDNDDMKAGSSTQFLIWNGKEYETYTGIRNVPTYVDYDAAWYVDARNDGVADIIFVVNPEGETDSNTVLYFFNGRLTEKTVLKDKNVDYYTLTGGYVNGEKETISTESETIVSAISGSKGILVLLTVDDGYVVDVEPVTETPVSVKVNGATYYAVYAGAAKDADLEDDVLMPADGEAYDVADLDNTITYNYDLEKTLKKDGNAFLYVVYTQKKAGAIKVADTVYITNVPSVDTIVADADALAAAIAAAEDGDTILVAGDIELDDNTYFEVTKKITIQGANGATITGKTTTDYWPGLFTFTAGSEGSTLKDLTINFTSTGAQTSAIYFEGGFAGSADAKTTIENVTFNGAAKLANIGQETAITSTYGVGGYLDITDCSFTNFKYAMYFNQINNVTITGNTINGTKYNAINVAADNATYSCDKVTITGNTLTNISSGNWPDDIYAAGISHGAHVTDFTVEDNDISMLNGKPAVYPTV